MEKDTILETHSVLNNEQQDIVSSVLDNKDVLITGSAGTGKSFLIKYLCKEFDKLQKAYVVLAPTGVAAVNIGGQTIHRFLGLRPEVKCLTDYIKTCMKKSRVPWNQLNVILIDEISMVHPNLFTMFDKICRLHKNKDIPFGGIQLIMLGDYFQLAPIPEKTDTKIDASYVFETEIWKKMNIKTHLLKKVMRQNEKDFIDALNDIRVGKFTSRVKELITKCANNEKIRDKHYVKLFSLNIQKNFANETELEKLETEKRIFKSLDTGDEKYLVGCLAEKVITLKIGCPVMLLWNIPEDDLCNGSVGILESFDAIGLPVVSFNNGVTTTILKQTWSITEKRKNNNYTLASRTQVPLAMAWALSVHKSQGLTLDYVECDVKGIFTTGQLYVMLSRASSSTGLIIRNFKKNAILVDEKVTKFYKTQ